MVTAPRGVNLREAIGQALSQSQLDAESADLAASQQWGSLPGTPASLPAALASPATAAQDGWLPGGAAAEAPLDQQQADGIPAGRVAPGQQPADWQWLLRGRFQGSSLEQGDGSAQLSLSMRPPPLPGAATAAPPALLPQEQPEQGSALEAAEQQRQRPRATTLDQLELLQSEAPGMRLEGARPWSYDGTAASLGVPRTLKPSSLEVAYRARAAGEMAWGAHDVRMHVGRCWLTGWEASQLLVLCIQVSSSNADHSHAPVCPAARMWPMLAPFVPRMLRQLILQAGPLPSLDGGAGRWGVGTSCLGLALLGGCIAASCVRGYLRS